MIANFELNLALRYHTNYYFNFPRFRLNFTWYLIAQYFMIAMIFDWPFVPEMSSISFIGQVRARYNAEDPSTVNGRRDGFLIGPRSDIWALLEGMCIEYTCHVAVLWNFSGDSIGRNDWGHVHWPRHYEDHSEVFKMASFNDQANEFLWGILSYIGLQLISELSEALFTRIPVVVQNLLM